MTQRQDSHQVEFIRLNDTAIRVTSWTELGPEQFRLVAIVRGSGDARALAEVLDADQLELEVPGQQVRPVAIAALDRRESGEPPAVITRFAIDFVPTSDILFAPPHRSLEERVSALEQEVAALRQLIAAIGNDR